MSAGSPEVGPGAEDSPALGVVCPDAAATQAIAGAVATVLEAGDVVLLSGELGAGKTTFTQGVAVARGVAEAVTSPTFTLVRGYPTPGGPELLHADVYRLERLREIVDLGLPELLEEDAFVLVEWGERAEAALGPDHLDVHLDVREDGARVVTLRPGGRRWEARWPRLAEAVGAAAGRRGGGSA